MTRLTEKDLAGIDRSIRVYECELVEKTGLTLAGIACAAAGISESMFAEAAGRIKVYAVPVTAGKGLIPGFVESVRSIAGYLGFQAKVTDHNDVSGIAEAVADGAGLAFMADDRTFIAANFATGNVAENSVATARGYVAALNFMVKGLRGADVLVIGAGRVGTRAIDYLRELGANAALFEINPKRLRCWKNTGVKIEKNLFRVLPRYKYIIDASPEPGFIDLEHLHPDVAIAAPGIPLGLTPRAYEACKGRVIHDPLQLGVASMLAMAVR